MAYFNDDMSEEEIKRLYGLSAHRVGAILRKDLNIHPIRSNRGFIVPLRFAEYFKALQTRFGIEDKLLEEYEKDDE